jgi:uncharacterized protein (DUF427 family)
MSLTLGTGPLARPPVGHLNADLWTVAPDRVLYLHPLDRRIRGELGGEVVVDSTRGWMLHETGLMPRWYLAYEDVREDLLVPSGTRTRCPYKGEASYWSVRVGDRVAEDALWTYAEPIPGAPPLAGLVSFYLGRLDAWYEEDEKLIAHPRDPFHRVDTRRSSRHVVVRVGDEVVAESRWPVAVLETGVGARWYLPPDDVREELLEPSATTSRCPYKGLATYEHIVAGGTRVDDAVWGYREPLPEALAVAGYRCFGGEGIEVVVDGQPA